MAKWVYMPRIVKKDDFNKYYEVLKSLVSKEQDDITVYGKKYKEPRFKSFFSRDGHSYNYSSTHNTSSGWPAEIEELAAMAKVLIGCDEDFDSALLNYYPDGNFGVGKHNDKDAMDGYIASFSFGATRKFHIRDIKTDKIVTSIDLEDSSLLIMKPGMQQKYKHEVPKSKKVKEGRINVTLRQHQSKKRKAEGDPELQE